MDGTFRNIDVKVAGDKFKLSYRRGYVARDTGVPGNAMAIRAQAIDKLAEQNPGAVNPLLPFMELGMPQSQQILYKVKIQPLAAKADATAQQGGQATRWTSPSISRTWTSNWTLTDCTKASSIFL
jgi:hypothetical protein